MIVHSIEDHPRVSGLRIIHDCYRMKNVGLHVERNVMHWWCRESTIN